MNKKKNTKGFTLAEMLIVIAIIGILISIVTTAVSDTLERGCEAVDMSNIRSAYAELANVALYGDKMNKTYMYYTSQNSYYTVWIKPAQKKNGWQSKNAVGEDGRVIIGGCHVAAPNVESNRVFKLLFYVNERAAKDVTNPEPYYFRVEAYSLDEFNKKKVKFYNEK